MLYEVDVTVPRPLDERTRQVLDACRRGANQVVRFDGDGRSIRLTVEVAGLSRTEAIRAAAGEVARILPDCDAEFSELRQRRATGPT
jgi:N-acetylglutamate synthase/N-acetylornithine aminotransferase